MEQLTNTQCVDCSKYHDLGKCLQSTSISGLPQITSLDLERKLCNKCDTIVSEIETHDCQTGDITSYHVNERERRRLYNGMPLGFTYMDFLCLGDQLNKGFVVVDDRDISQEQFPELFKALKRSGRSDLRNTTCLKLSDIIKPGRIPITTGGELDMDCGEVRGDADGTITMNCENIPRCPIKSKITPERHNHDFSGEVNVPLDRDGTTGDEHTTWETDQDTDNTQPLKFSGKTEGTQLKVTVEHQVGIAQGGTPKPIKILPPVQAGCMMIKISLDPICDGIKQLDPCNDCK